MAEEIKKMGKSFVDTIKGRFDGELSGPFFIALFFVFWEIPIYLFSNHADEKIASIKSVITPSFGEITDLHRLTIVGLAWVFWVFIAPLISPFFRRLRSSLITWSEQVNRYEAYKKLKTDLDLTIAQRAEFEARLKQEDNFFKLLEQHVISQTNPKNAYRAMLKKAQALPIGVSPADSQALKAVLERVELEYNEMNEMQLQQFMMQKITISSAVLFFKTPLDSIESISEYVKKHSNDRNLWNKEKGKLQNEIERSLKGKNLNMLALLFKKIRRVLGR